MGCLLRRTILSTTEVTTFAGGISSGATNGFGTFATFNALNDVELSPDDTYALVGDKNNQLVRKIIISTAQVTTFAKRKI
jgi:hypothetical protein